jgi:flagellar biogenesis protein FliO
MNRVRTSAHTNRLQARLFFLVLLLPATGSATSSEEPQAPNAEIVESDMRAIQLLMQEVAPDESKPELTRELTTEVSTQPLDTQEQTQATEGETTSPTPIVPQNATAALAETEASSSTPIAAAELTSSVAQENASAPSNQIPEKQQNGGQSDLSPFHSEGASKLDQDLWKSTAAIFGVLLLIAMGAIHLLKRRAAGDAPGAPAGKPLQLISTLPVGPKRQILLIRVRDQEVAVASTEAGISVLSPQSPIYLASDIQAQRSVGANAVQEDVAPLPLTGATQDPSTVARPLLTQKRRLQPAQESLTIGEARSEILRKAVETIERRRSSASQSLSQPSASVPTPAAATSAPSQRPQNAAPEGNEQTPSLTPLKKFLTHQYGKSSVPQGTLGANKSRADARPRAQTEPNKASNPQAVTPGSSASSQSDNVAQLIREKLKQMKTIN